MKVIAIKCYGYRDVERMFKMLKEIFSILHTSCYLYRTNNKIVVDQNVYKLINAANPLYEQKVRSERFDRVINSSEISKIYDNMKFNLYNKIF